jgi:hypothetical protein
MVFKHEQNRRSPLVAVSTLKRTKINNIVQHKDTHTYACLRDVGIASSQCVAQQNTSRAANKRFARQLKNASRYALQYSICYDSCFDIRRTSIHRACK